MNIRLNKKAAAFAGGVVSMACLVACGDDITQVTNVGMDTVAAYEDLSECTAQNEGVLIYVKDKGNTYLCSDESWHSVKGEDGKNGENGTSCTVKELTDGSGFDVVCGDKKVGTLKNGEAGKAGTNGTSCTVSENAAKNGYDLVCGDKTVTVKNGTSGESCKGTALENGNIKITCGTTVVGELKKGTNGTNGKSAYELSGFEGTEAEWLASLKGAAGENCTVADVEGGVKVTCNGVSKTVLNGTDGDDGDDGTSCTITGDKDGKVTLACGEGESVVETTLYKAVCGATPYDPATKFCFNMELNDLCGTDKKAFDPTKFECVEGVVKERVPSMCKGVEYDPTNQFCAKRGTEEERLYKMKKIVDQTWMAENLNYSTENSWCGGGSGTTEGDCTTYGRLYTWAAAKAACLDGWHLPTKAEFETLITSAGGSLAAGKALKSSSGWNGNGNGTNASGFSALPAGSRDGNEGFDNEGNLALFWSSTVNFGDLVYYMSLSSSNDEAYLLSYDKRLGLSVRYIQNDPQ